MSGIGYLRSSGRPNCDLDNESRFLVLRSAAAAAWGSAPRWPSPLRLPCFSHTPDSGQATPVVLGATGATGIDAKLPVGHLVSGVVRDASGAPAKVDVSDCTTTICVY